MGFSSQRITPMIQFFSSVCVFTCCPSLLGKNYPKLLVHQIGDYKYWSQHKSDMGKHPFEMTWMWKGAETFWCQGGHLFMWHGWLQRPRQRTAARMRRHQTTACPDNPNTHPQTHCFGISFFLVAISAWNDDPRFTFFSMVVTRVPATETTVSIEVL